MEYDERSDCCSVEGVSGHGDAMCPETAAMLPALQARKLLDDVGASGDDDLLDVLDGIAEKGLF